jgi:hypothetical protein
MHLSSRHDPCKPSCCHRPCTPPQCTRCTPARAPGARQPRGGGGAPAPIIRVAAALARQRSAAARPLRAPLHSRLAPCCSSALRARLLAVCSGSGPLRAPVRACGSLSQTSGSVSGLRPSRADLRLPEGAEGPAAACALLSRPAAIALVVQVAPALLPAALAGVGDARAGEHAPQVGAAAH